MSRLNDLLRQLETTDPALAKDLRREVDALSNRRAFGLNFERHVPEAVELPGRRPVRRGDKVRILPPRGTQGCLGDDRLWRAVAITKDASGTRTASLELLGGEDETAEAPVDDLVVVAEFRDPIYPGLVSTGSVERGGEKPFHAVINAENYHALQTLLFTHRAKVDVIYIDPPYNTGAKDWKYNNNYVEDEDLYRHSKWLAFMERRLKLAKELLRSDGAMVITIDEHEVNRLGVLVDDLFPNFTRQLVTIINNPKGVTQGYLSRVEEYAFFVFGPEARLGNVDDDLLTHRDLDTSANDLQRPRWKGLLRSGDDSLRANRKDMFYPVWFDESTGRLSHAGDPLPWGETPSFLPESGLTPIWPIRTDLKEGRWGVGPATLNELISEGFAAAGRFDRRRRTWAVSYLSRQVRDDLGVGLLAVQGYNAATGVADVVYVDTAARRIRTVWHRSSHDAGAHGTDLIRNLLGTGRAFPFPKSLYAVEDSLRPLVRDKPLALIVDFFAGSGTTTHALARLNKQDGGHRRSISISNNEVAAAEQDTLRANGFRPGDPEWEQRGICDYITKPRIASAITGKTPDGQTIKGDYKFTDEFPISEGLNENVEFFTLTYEAPLRISSNREFAKVAPLLWLRAGSEGRRIDDISTGWDVADTYGVLADLNWAEAFVEAVASRDGIRMVFIVTDENRLFESVVRELPDHVEPVRLYEAYLQNFEIETGRAAL